MSVRLSANASKLYAIFQERTGPDGHVRLAGAPSPAELGLSTRQAVRAVLELRAAGLIEVRVEPGPSHRHRRGS